MSADDDDDSLPRIPVELITPLQGEMTLSIFENANIGLAPHLRAQIEIPFEPFDSGLDWVGQPEETSLCCEFVHFALRDWRVLPGQSFALDWPEAFDEPSQEASIYLGSRHNVLPQVSYEFTARKGRMLEVRIHGECDFEQEGVGLPAMIDVKQWVEFKGLTIKEEILDARDLQGAGALEFVGQFVELEGLASELIESTQMPGVTFYDPSLWLWLAPRVDGATG